jgi:type IV secretory pathway TraG/TraD family ATPase VirD4
MDETYIGHETWWNAIRMELKMHENIVKLLALVTLLLVAGLILASQRDAAAMVLVTRNLWDASSQYVNGIVSGQEYVGYLKLQLTAAGRELWYYPLILIFFPIAAYPACLRYFRRKAKEHSTTEYIRGARLVPVSELNRKIRDSGEKIRLRLGEILIPRSLDTFHFGVVGATGSGKTYSYFAPLVAALMEQREKGIIHCAKGEFTARFYNYEGALPETNLIYNPLDSRSLRWTIFNDISDVTDIERVAHRLIPVDRNIRDPNWENGARHILIGLLHYAHASGRTSNQELWNISIAPITDKLSWLKSTTYGAQGSHHLTDPASKMAQSYNSVFMLYINALQYLPDGDFSISEWLESGDSRPGFIFLMNNPRFEDTLRPSLSLFMDMFASKLVSMNDDPNRKLFLVLDEFGALNNLPAVVQILRLGRSKGAAVSIGVQEFGQIDKIYGREERQSILGNLNNLIVLRTRDTVTTRQLSEHFGETQYWQPEKTTSAGVEDFKDGVSFAKRTVTEPLVLPSQIQNLPPRHAYVFLTGHQAVARADIGCKRLYLTETERDGAQLVSSFELRSGLTLEETATSQPSIPAEPVRPATDENPPSGGGGVQLHQPEHEMREE